MMKIYDNGTYREMTEEEIASMKVAEPARVPTLEERLEAVEMALLEQLLGGLNNV
jgi:hypothetical protein